MLDPGGLQDLRLGMTLAQAQGTHWVTGTSGGCPFDAAAKAIVFQPAVKASGEFRNGKIAWLGLRQAPGRTREGLKVAAPASTLGAVYPAPTWQVVIGPVDDIFGVKFVTISKAGKVNYAAVINPGTDKISEISVPYTATCD